MKLVDMIAEINATVQAEDAKIQVALQASQKVYADKLEEMKQRVADNGYLSYELGRFACSPHQYQLPASEIPLEAAPVDTGNVIQLTH